MILSDVINILRRTPPALELLLADLPDRWINATEGKDTWSAYDVVGHLIHGERTDWMRRLEQILSESKAPFEPFDRMAQFKESKGKSMRELLDTFSELRRENIEKLEAMNLIPPDFDRKGQHPDFGEVTLGQLLATWTVHDLSHIAQISRVMAKVYKEDVGPWSAYLSVLRDRER